MAYYVAKCDKPTHPEGWVHDCDTGNVLYIPPGYEWTGQTNGAIKKINK